MDNNSNNNEQANIPTMTSAMTSDNINPQAIDPTKNIPVGVGLAGTKINTVTISSDESIQAQEYKETSDVQLSGTAHESELTVEEVKAETELLSEQVLKRDVKIDEKKYKKNTMFIVL